MKYFKKHKLIGVSVVLIGLFWIAVQTGILYTHKKYPSVEEIQTMFYKNYTLFTEVGEILAANTPFWQNIRNKSDNRHFMSPTGYDHELFFSEEQWQKVRELFRVSRPHAIVFFPVATRVNDYTSIMIEFDYVISSDNDVAFANSVYYLYTYGVGNHEDAIESRKQQESAAKSWFGSRGKYTKLDDNWFQLEWFP